MIPMYAIPSNSCAKERSHITNALVMRSASLKIEQIAKISTRIILRLTDHINQALSKSVIIKKRYLRNEKTQDLSFVIGLVFSL